jgi:hypothetical protein
MAHAMAAGAWCGPIVCRGEEAIYLAEQFNLCTKGIVKTILQSQELLSVPDVKEL